MAWLVCRIGKGRAIGKYESLEKGERLPGVYLLRCVKMLAHWLGCFEWLDWCVVFVCKMVVRFFIWYSLWELWVVLLVVGVHFGSSYGPLGSIFEGFGGLLGIILGALGIRLAPF